MTALEDIIHTVAQEELKKKINLETVSLKHPLPERPLRTLGLVKIDGQVFQSEKLSRAVFLQVYAPVYVTIRSMFLRPGMEYDLPVFACEVMVTGSKKMVIVDIHRTGQDTGHDDSGLFDSMVQIRDRYPGLHRYAVKQKGEIQSVFSHAACQVKIPVEMDDQVLGLFKDYLRLFIEMLAAARPISGDVLENIRQKYEEYLKTLVDHDPGVNVYKMLFGKKGGVERSMDMHFAR